MHTLSDEVLGFAAQVGRSLDGGLFKCDMFDGVGDEILKKWGASFGEFPLTGLAERYLLYMLAVSRRYSLEDAKHMVAVLAYNKIFNTGQSRGRGRAVQRQLIISD